MTNETVVTQKICNG